MSVFNVARGTYESDYDVADRYLRLTMRGLWDLRTVASFVATMTALSLKAAAAGHTDVRGRILLDLSELAIQPPAVGSVLGTLLPRFGTRAGRVAVVPSASSIQRQQLKRLLASEKVRMFDTVPLARAWLEAPASC